MIRHVSEAIGTLKGMHGRVGMDVCRFSYTFNCVPIADSETLFVESFNVTCMKIRLQMLMTNNCAVGEKRYTRGSL